VTAVRTESRNEQSLAYLEGACASQEAKELVSSEVHRLVK
jgi:hypothetical protein